MLLFVVTYDEQCCKEKGITEKCLGICHDQRFLDPFQSSRSLQTPGSPPRLPPTACDQFEYLKKACLVPIPEKDFGRKLVPILMRCNYRFLGYKAFTLYYI